MKKHKIDPVGDLLAELQSGVGAELSKAELRDQLKAFILGLQVTLGRLEQEIVAEEGEAQ